MAGNYSFEGYYVDSRLIGEYVYIVSTKYINRYDNIEPLVYYEGNLKSEVVAGDIHYFGFPESNYVFNIVFCFIHQHTYSFTFIYHISGFYGVFEMQIGTVSGVFLINNCRNPTLSIHRVTLFNS